MLRDGQFLREPPVQIGAHYVRPLRNDFTPEEYLVQEVLLGGGGDAVSSVRRGWRAAAQVLGQAISTTIHANWVATRRST